MIAITAGDPGGIGPEVTVKALRALRGKVRATVIGDPGSLVRVGWSDSLGRLLPVGVGSAFRFGAINAEQGGASFRAVRVAAALALKGKVAALVTAPVSKEAWALARTGYLGHTEYLRDMSGSRRAAMMFEADGLRAALVTGHIPLKDVPRSIKAKDVSETARLVLEELRSRLGLASPRVALCALNPHAGESGHIGTEEKRILAPALKGSGVVGPIAADAAWAGMRLKQYDAVIALYHDQALIPLKVVSPFGVVHWTLGIPFVRTSPGHGTGFDIAGKNKARPDAMIEAIKLAVRLAR